MVSRVFEDSENIDSNVITIQEKHSLELKFTVSECAGLAIQVTSFLISGEWMWIDNSVVDYTNWNRGLKTEYCVDMDSETGRWSTSSCRRYMSYICKTAKGKFNWL